MEKITAKTILSSLKEDPYNIFGLRYNMNLYRGCQHGCIYCDSRSDCYKIGNLAHIRVKENAIELLSKELKAKKIKGTIGTGSMNDPYMPIEKDLNLMRQALVLINYYKFPIHIITKSNLVARDIDLLKETAKIYAAVSFTITTFDDVLAKQLEPHAPLTSERFKALEELSKSGIYAGITLMPILPYINDSIENIENIVHQAKKSGASYIIAWFGMTLRDSQREYYYKQLEKLFPESVAKYKQTFGEQYSCSSPNARFLQESLNVLCKKLDITLKMRFYEPPQIKQTSLLFE